MRNPLKFVGVPQTGKPIAADSGPKFTIARGRVEENCCLTSYFRLSIHALVAKIQLDKVVRWCPNGEILAIFASCIFSKPRAVHLKPPAF